MQPTDVCVCWGGGRDFSSQNSPLPQRTDLINTHGERAVVLLLQPHIPKAILSLETCGHNTFYEVGLRRVTESSF